MDPKINILFVMTGQPHIFGGGKRLFMQIMKGLPKHTFNVSSCCSLSGEQEKGLITEGVKIIKLSLASNNPISCILRLSNVMRREHIDIVHSQGGRADVYSRVAARIAKVPMVVNTCTMLVEGYDLMFMKKIMYVLCDRITERFVDRFIVVSDSLREILVTHHGIRPDKIIKIYPGVELDQYQPSDEAKEKIRRECRVREDEFLVGSVGRLVYQKGFEFLLKGVPSVLQSFPKTKFIVVGDGPFKLKLETLAKELRILENCMFVGFRDDIGDVLSSLDVFVLPSILEGHPYAILEAMAMARAIVTTDINGIREGIEDGKTGILVPPGNPQALAEAITRLFKDRVKAASGPSRGSL